MSSTQIQESASAAESDEKTTSDPLRLAVFISGSGRTLKNLIERSGEDFEVVSVVADRQCTGLIYARDARLPTFTAHSPTYIQAMWNAALEDRPDYICLAGFLNLLPIPCEFHHKVLNIHPSLIPKFCGQGMFGNKVHKAVLEAKETESGCTVHFCDNQYDHGDIILQKKLTIDPSWDHVDLAAAVFELEKEAYPEAIISLR